MSTIRDITEKYSKLATGGPWSAGPGPRPGRKKGKKGRRTKKVGGAGYSKSNPTSTPDLHAHWHTEHKAGPSHSYTTTKHGTYRHIESELTFTPHGGTWKDATPLGSGVSYNSARHRAAEHHDSLTK